MNAQYYTLAEVAFYLHVSARTVRRMIASGDLPASKVGGSVRIDPADLSAFVSESRVEPKKTSRRRWKGLDVTPQKLAARAYFSAKYQGKKQAAAARD